MPREVFEKTSSMETYKVVRPSHLNHYGYLFGGELLKWVDEISWVAATQDYPGCKFVTVSMDRVVFECSVRQGTVLRFDTQRHKVGTSSVHYEVKVYADNLDTGDEESVFSTHITFVCLDHDGGKMPLPELHTTVRR